MIFHNTIHFFEKYASLTQQLMDALHLRSGPSHALVWANVRSSYLNPLSMEASQ